MSTTISAGKPHHLIRFDVCCIVFVGGAVGTALRYAFSMLPTADAFHTGTFVANMIAALCYAALSAYLSAASWIRQQVKEPMNRGLGMGLCGGLSTMSTLALEEFTALRGGEMTGMIIYCLATFACGLLLAWLGATAGSALARMYAMKATGEAVEDNMTEEAAR